MSPPANQARGEVLRPLARAPCRLCLTLGALAEIETALNLDHAAALGERMRSPSARDLTAVLGALLRGGGEDAFAAALDSAQVDPAELWPPSPPPSRPWAEVDPTPWSALLRLAAERFAIPPEAFWRLSVAEWTALTATRDAPAPLNRAKLDALLAAFPDEAPPPPARTSP